MLPERTKDENLADYVSRLTEEERQAMAKARKAAVQAIAGKVFAQLQDTVRDIARSRAFGGVGDIDIPLENVLVQLDEYTDKIYKSPEEMIEASLWELTELVNQQTGVYGIEAYISLPDWQQIVDVQLIRR